MSRDWTIDTNVLYAAARVDCDAVELLNSIQRKQESIGLDHEGAIISEYNLCLKKVMLQKYVGAVALTKLFKHMVSKCPIHFCGALDEKHKTALLDLKFSHKDLPFVGVCHKTQDKRLVTSDYNHYNTDVKCYLADKLCLKVLSVSEALK